jgi:orotidine-5'-phosphate decarboxylase
MKPNLLSTKNLPIRERLIFALDVPGADEARKLVDELGDSVIFYKLAGISSLWIG